MAKAYGKLLNQLNEFLLCEIGVKAIDGITYRLLRKNEKNYEETLKRYMTIKDEALKAGYSQDEVFRVYELSNGYIFDMDLKTAKQIVYEMSKVVASENNGETPVGDLIGDKPEQRRKRDMIALAKYIKEQYDNGVREVEVALFSRNSTNQIMVTGTTASGQRGVVRYNAYAIRHWDLEAINSQLLMKAGIKINSIRPCGILPSSTGVSFILKFDTYKDLGKV